MRRGLSLSERPQRTVPERDQTLSRQKSRPSGPHCAFCGLPAGKELGGPRAPWSYRRCRGCGHVALHPQPTDAELAEYYNEAYQIPREDYRRAVADAFPMVKTTVGGAPRRMLEIGCSYGYMLDRFRARGWNVTGVEIDRRAALHAREQLGLDVRAGRLHDVADSLPGPFDVVTLFHVIEHITDPAGFMARLRQLLAPEGILVLRTPNAASVGAKALGGWWEWCAAPEHVHLYTPESLARLLAQAGFRVTRQSTRKGDARGFIHQLVHGALRSLIRRDYRLPLAGPSCDRHTSSRKSARRAVSRVLESASVPFDTLLGRVFSEGGPELVVRASVDGPPGSGDAGPR